MRRFRLALIVLSLFLLGGGSQTALAVSASSVTFDSGTGVATYFDFNTSTTSYYSITVESKITNSEVPWFGYTSQP